jgi:dipeptidyl-peptidase 4
LSQVDQPQGISAHNIYLAYLQRSRLVAGGFVAPNWTRDGKGLLFAQGGPGDGAIVKVDLGAGTASPVLDVASVRTALAGASGHEPPYRGLPFTGFQEDEDGRIRFVYEEDTWLVDPDTSELKRGPAIDPLMQSLGWSPNADLKPRRWSRVDYLSLTLPVPEQRSPSGEWFASIRDGNIVLRSARGTTASERLLTHDASPECYWDIEAERLKDLSGRRFAFRAVNPWSPDSLTLLACRRDTSGVFRAARIDWLVAFEQVTYFARAKAGGKLDRLQAFFVDVRSGNLTPARLPALAEHYLQFLAWHPGGNEALLIAYSRDFRVVTIFAAHRETGVVRELLRESSRTFVKIWHSAIFSGEHGFHLLPDGSGFLWLSTRDGWNHLYHYDMTGNLLGQLTSGDWPVHEIAHIADARVYFTGSIDRARPYDVHVCRVPLQGGSVEQLTRDKGIHSPTFAPTGQAFLDSHSAVDRPTRTDLVKADGTRLRVLSEMDISRLEAIGYRPPEEFTVKAADGATDVWGVLYKPIDFDPSCSYPVIEYIYGGPQTIETPRFFAVEKRMMRSVNVPWALAHLGYIVVCLDGRGTPGRSKAFHDVICGNWTAGIDDHIRAMDQLCQRHDWMDARRVGIYGHSWGGYFATAALIRAPDTYYAGVAYAPGYDPWDSILYEPYLGLPCHNRAAYESADLVRHATGLRRPLLIAVGTSDLNFNSSMKMTRALIDAGIDHELVVVPGAFHHFSGTEEDYLLSKLTAWFDRHVRSVAPRSTRHSSD